MGCFFQLCGLCYLGDASSKNYWGDLVHIELVAEDARLYMLLAGLLGAITWNIITWYVGLPTFQAHTR